MFKLIGFVKKTLLEGLGAVTDKLCYFILNVVYPFTIFLLSGQDAAQLEKSCIDSEFFFQGEGLGTPNFCAKSLLRRQEAGENKPV